ncbi:MAG: methionine aminotransferase [Xanthomonadales bacterium]|nr:methionine aminotransferase [Xanthomonadales bacterium]
MSQMAAEHEAINLSQGFPDFDGPEALREGVARHMAQGHNQYAPLAGVPALQEQIAAKLFDLYGAQVQPGAGVAVTPGATEAIFCALSASVHGGDEVILFDPAYDTYEPCVRLNGGRARRIPLRGPDFTVDWQRVADQISSRTRAIVLNNPHNPTGACWKERDIEALRRVVAGRDIVLVADEVYEHMVFDGRAHLSLLRYPDLAERAFCIYSFGKTYHVTGWRIGYCVAPPAFMKEFLKIHQFINFSTNAPLQYALADFMRDCPEHHRQLADFYQRKRDLFDDLLRGSRFRLTPSAGTFFQLADYSAISVEPDHDFVAWLTREHKVAAIPLSVFYEHPPARHLIRFCFAKNDATLREAAQRLCAV